MAQCLPSIFVFEGDAPSFIRARVAAETEIHADEAGGRDALHAHYRHLRPAIWAQAPRPSCGLL